MKDKEVKSLFALIDPKSQEILNVKMASKTAEVQNEIQNKKRIKI